MGYLEVDGDLTLFPMVEVLVEGQEVEVPIQLVDDGLY